MGLLAARLALVIVQGNAKGFLMRSFIVVISVYSFTEHMVSYRNATYLNIPGTITGTLAIIKIYGLASSSRISSVR
jgi:hypothetical protein